MHTVELLLSLVTELSRPGSALRERALDALVDDGSLSAPMAERVLGLCLARYTPKSLQALDSSRWQGRLVRVVLGASVPVAPLRALALPLLSGARALRVKPSSSQPRFVSLLIESMSLRGLALSLDDQSPSDVVVAYGRDETLSQLRDGLAPGVEFHGYGHGYGVSVVTTVRSGGLRDAAREVAREVALDVALYDQRGCLSPQTVLVCGDPREFAHELHRALGALDGELPRGAVGAGEAAQWLEWLSRQAVFADFILRGESHCVSVYATSESVGLVPSPGGRHIAVVGVSSVDEISRVLARHGRNVSVVGGAGDRWREGVPLDFSGRVVPAGQMQDPALDGPEDRRPALRQK